MLKLLGVSVFLFVLGFAFMLPCEWAMAKCPDHLDLPTGHEAASAATSFQHNLANVTGLTGGTCFLLGMVGVGVAAIGGAWRAIAWACRTLREGWRLHRRGQAAVQPLGVRPVPPGVWQRPKVGSGVEILPEEADTPLPALTGTAMSGVSVTPEFIREGCTALVGNACDVIRLAGREASIMALLGVAASLPRGNAELNDRRWQGRECFQALLRAEERSKGTPDEARGRELFAYFLEHVPQMEPAARQMIQEAFVGVLQGIAPAWGREC